MEKIVVPFTPAYEDWLHARRILRRKEKMHYLYDFGFPLGLCVGLLAAMVQPPYSITLMTVGTLAVMCIAAYPLLLRRWQWRNHWSKEQGRAFIELSNDAVSVRHESADLQRNSSVPWLAVKAFDEDARVFFLLTKGAMLFVPKSSLSTCQSDAIRTLALDKVGV